MTIYGNEAVIWACETSTGTLHVGERSQWISEGR